MSAASNLKTSFKTYHPPVGPHKAGHLIDLLFAAKEADFTHVFWEASECVIAVAIGKLATGYGSEETIVVEERHVIVEPILIG